MGLVHIGAVSLGRSFSMDSFIFLVIARVLVLAPVSLLVLVLDILVIVVGVGGRREEEGAGWRRRRSWW